MLDVYTGEFHAHTKAYYEGAIQSGKISVNGKTVSCDYVLKDSDKIMHTVMRKETPVLMEPKIDVLYEDDDYLAVDKPPSMPVHEGGC